MFMSAKVAAVDFPPMVRVAPDSKLLPRIVTVDAPPADALEGDRRC